MRKKERRRLGTSFCLPLSLCFSRLRAERQTHPLPFLHQTATQSSSSTARSSNSERRTAEHSNPSQGHSQERGRTCNDRQRSLGAFLHYLHFGVGFKKLSVGSTQSAPRLSHLPATSRGLTRSLPSTEQLPYQSQLLQLRTRNPPITRPYLEHVALINQCPLHVNPPSST